MMTPNTQEVLPHGYLFTHMPICLVLVCQRECVYVSVFFFDGSVDVPGLLQIGIGWWQACHSKLSDMAGKLVHVCVCVCVCCLRFSTCVCV